jgi:hypothetical protein
MKGKIAIALAMVGLLSVAVLAQQVNVDWQRGQDFTKYKSFAWGSSQHPIQDDMWSQRVVGLIEDQLKAKGLTKVDAAANPTLIVVYNAGIKQNESLQGYRTGGFFMGGSGSIQKVIEQEGTLVVDMYDPASKAHVWRGVAEETLSDKSDKNIKKVQDMVKKMFEKYPPKDKT